MQRSHHLWVPISLGVLAILFTLAILVGWSILFTHYYTLNARIQRVPDLGVGFWFLLAVGCLFLVAVVVALIVLLVGNVRRTLDIRRQNVFIDGVTHEFKSPLASIRLCLETMEMRSLSPEMQQRFIQMMMKDVERLSAFIEHILEASRIEHDGRALRQEDVSLSEIALRSAQLVRSRYERSKPQIELIDHLPDPSPALNTDPVALETVLINLLDNAIKYSPEPAQVILALEQDDDTLRISVTDQGIGIPKRLLKRVFQRFYRINREQTPIPRGTGLGLYVVASLVKRLGGHIRAKSEGEGKGSCFVVEFPYRPQKKTVDANKPARTASTKSEKHLSV
ncbi:MAG: HAMP domain-containing histidine kinase [Myxococcales bacterium]|nr:HAMP domain-containing histidine kinase [Myxococcales bacterium]MCB9644091.1 HAMP domain-containing histidine kinase [Myxococcales bacterium]